ncbi:MAG TPA: NAD-dependent epimerase/dehydratase family protein [Pirellulaceae bacterium]|nr:NAD-dependent epimerase/dehydratase family protein [Pirellulaceae bacterium]
MRILITGATGLVGNNVLRTLLHQQQHSVRLLVRNPHDPALQGLDVEKITGDVRDPAAVRQAVAGCGAVIHCAGVVTLGWTRLAEDREINVGGTQHVINAALDHGARLVHISSINTLGIGRRDLPSNEETPHDGQVACTYVITKREGEAAVDAAVKQGLDAVVIHPGFMLGPWDWKPSSAKMFVAVAKTWTPLAPTGGCSVCDVRDVAQAIITAAERAPQGRHYILAGENISYFDLWRKMAIVANSSPPRWRLGPVNRFIGGVAGDLVALVTRREREVNSASIAMSCQWHYYASDRAEQDLGYRFRAIDETLADTWSWLLEHGYV